jgi:hypothetical protein
MSETDRSEFEKQAWSRYYGPFSAGILGRKCYKIYFGEVHITVTKGTFSAETDP